MLLLQPKWLIPYIEVQCCTVDDTVYTVKYCKKNKQTDDNMWLYFSRMTRRPSGGGRQRLFTQQQELPIVDLVRADNAIRLHQLRRKILADRRVFSNIDHVSITTIRRILGKHSITMKQLYRVPFERNSDRVKGLRAEYVRRILAMDGAAQPHEYIFIDEAGFDLSKTRRRGRNVIGQRAIGMIELRIKTLKELQKRKGQVKEERNKEKMQDTGEKGLPQLGPEPVWTEL
ncbi:uncharacterized protein LOC113009413 [Astatotilapia calliptera]|uniref:uncharacterized protein LOC113009413 n=1 Tax=Astatotilapia calliptera TaxID=8154 RepID=UPI000E415D10|nr:uncharacterized protein LOC113009413 [Astatotilapia calliptera]